MSEKKGKSKLSPLRNLILGMAFSTFIGCSMPQQVKVVEKECPTEDVSEGYIPIDSTEIEHYLGKLKREISNMGGVLNSPNGLEYLIGSVSLEIETNYIVSSNENGENIKLVSLYLGIEDSYQNYEKVRIVLSEQESDFLPFNPRENNDISLENLSKIKSIAIDSEDGDLYYENGKGVFDYNPEHSNPFNEPYKITLPFLSERDFSVKFSYQGYESEGVRVSKNPEGDFTLTPFGLLTDPSGKEYNNQHRNVEGLDRDDLEVTITRNGEDYVVSGRDF